MKVTEFTTEGLPLAFSGPYFGVSSVNSNFNTTDGGFSATNFVMGITANGSNMLLRPIANFAAGSNIWLSLDAGPGNSIPSNTIRIHSTGGGGGNIITSNGSNSLAAIVNLKAGVGIALGVSGQDITITNTGSGGGGGGGTSLTTAQQILTTGDVTLALNSFTDIVSVSLAAGTWLVTAQASVTCSSQQDSTCRISDGTNHFASSSMSHTAAFDYSHHLSSLIVLSSTTTVKLQGTHNVAGTVTANQDTPTNASGHTATQINAVKVA